MCVKFKRVCVKFIHVCEVQTGMCEVQTGMCEVQTGMCEVHTPARTPHGRAWDSSGIKAGFAGIAKNCSPNLVLKLGLDYAHVRVRNRKRAITDNQVSDSCVITPLWCIPDSRR